MDPTATFRQMREADDDGERRELALALLGWLDTGGFPPDGLNVADASTMCRAVVAGR